MERGTIEAIFETTARELEMNDRLMAFGKYKGKPISAVPLDYLQWCYNNFEDGKRRTLLQIEIERRQRLCPEHLKADRRPETKPFDILTGPKTGKAGQQTERVIYPTTMSRPALSRKERKKLNKLRREHERKCQVTQEFREIFAITPQPQEFRLTQGAYAGKLISELPEHYVKLMARHCDTDTGKQCADYLNRKNIKVNIAEIRKPENWLSAPTNTTPVKPAIPSTDIDSLTAARFANVARAKELGVNGAVDITAEECPY
jgi:uncharacterized protein (DUF3820 family)